MARGSEERGGLPVLHFFSAALKCLRARVSLVSTVLTGTRISAAISS